MRSYGLARRGRIFTVTDAPYQLDALGFLHLIDCVRWCRSRRPGWRICDRVVAPMPDRWRWSITTSRSGTGVGGSGGPWQWRQSGSATRRRSSGVWSSSKITSWSRAPSGSPARGCAPGVDETNGDVARAALSWDTGTREQRSVVLGAEEISSASIAIQPSAAMSSVLGLREIDALMIQMCACGRRSTLSGSGAGARVRPTPAYERARTVLDRHRFVVLTGPPEMGNPRSRRCSRSRTSPMAGRHISAATPTGLARIRSRPAEVFVADDAFGSTEYRPDAAERWARGLGRLLEMLDPQHWLIWTSRPAPLKAGLRRVQRESGAERFPTPGEVSSTPATSIWRTRR